MKKEKYWLTLRVDGKKVGSMKEIKLRADEKLSLTFELELQSAAADRAVKELE